MGIADYQLLTANTLIHEIGHLFVRINCTSSKAIIECNSRELSFESTSTNNQPAKKESYDAPERGFQLEERVFGKRIMKLNTLAADFIMNPVNLSTEDFLQKIYSFDHEKFDLDVKEVESIRMRRNLGQVAYFDGDWCRTFHYKNGPNN